MTDRAHTTKGPSTRKLRAEMTRALAAFFKKQAPKMAGQIVLLRERHHFGVGKASRTQSEISAIDAIIAGIDFAGWSVLVGDIEPILADIVNDGGFDALRRIGIEVTADADVANVVNSFAADYAAGRSAEMVGMRIDELGRLVPNPNAVWQITDATRTYLRATVGQAIDEGWSNDRLRDAIIDSEGFSESRAMTIARTETNYASNQGALAGYKASGVVTGKQWLTAEDDKVSEECEANGDAGVLGLDEDFPSGDDAPPAHPNCRCTILPIVIEQNTTAAEAADEATE